MISLVTIKLLLALFLPVWFIRYYRWFLLWVPLFMVPGIYWVTTRYVPREYTFVECYIELVLVAGLFARWLRGRKDMVSVMIFFVGLSAVPSLVNSGDHFFFSLFLVLCLVMSAGVYQLFADEMEWMLDKRVVDLTILLWVGLGIFTKVYNAVRLDQSFLYQRSGGIWGSNHLGTILLLLIPFAHYRWVATLGVIFLLFNFSRGIWLALALLALLWGVTVSARRAVQGVAALAAVLLLVLLLLPANLRTMALEFAGDRYEGMSVDAMGQNERWQIYSSAMRMASATSYVGVGLGGYVWGLSEVLHEQPRFSNAHNLYLTALAEGGVLHAVALLLFLGFLAVWAYMVHRRAFCVLVTWLFYGLYSGEIYNSANLATAGDYYTLLFVAAILMYHTRLQLQPGTAEPLSLGSGPELLPETSPQAT